MPFRLGSNLIALYIGASSSHQSSGRSHGRKGRQDLPSPMVLSIGTGGVVFVSFVGANANAHGAYKCAWTHRAEACVSR